MTSERLFLVAAMAACVACSTPASAVKISGVVTDTSRVPVQGATVELVEDRPYYYLASQIEAHATAQTDSSGRFHVDAPDSGTLALLAWGPSHRRMKFPLNLDEAGKRTVGLALERGVTVEGKVMDTDGKPVANAVVGPIRASLDADMSVVRKVIPQWTTSAADGSFTFEGLMEKMDYQFVTAAPGYELRNTMVASGQKGAKIRLSRGGSKLSGRLVSKSVDPAVFPKLVVRLSGYGYEVCMAPDSKGAFAYEGLPNGDFVVEAMTQPPFLSRIVKVRFPRDAGRDDCDIELTDGYYVEGVTIDANTSTPAEGVPLVINEAHTTSGANGAFRLGPVWLTGRMSVSVDRASGFRLEREEDIDQFPDANGFDDVKNVVVRVKRRYNIRAEVTNYSATTSSVMLHLLSAEAQPQRTGMTTSTAEIGVFREGTYHLYAISGSLASEVTTVTVGPGMDERVRLFLAEASVLPGKVDVAGAAETTRPLGFSVRLYVGESETSGVMVSEAVTRGDGQFLFPSLPGGTYLALASNQSKTRQQSTHITLAPGRNPMLVFTFAPGRTLAGTVTDGEGKPVGEARVAYYSRRLDTRSLSGSCETDENGRFLAEDLEAEQLDKLTVTHPAFVAFTREGVKLPDTAMEIKLQKAGGLNVKVDAASRSEWRIFLMQSEPWRSGAYSDQLMSRAVFDNTCYGGEEVRINVQSEGRFRVVAVGAGGQLAVSEAFTWDPKNPSPDKSMVLVPGKTGRLSGPVGDASDSDIEVIATNTSLPEGAAQSEFQAKSSGGQFDLPQVPAGDYLVLATSEKVNAVATNIDLAPGGSARVELKGVTLGGISGHVTLGQAPVVGASIEMISQTDPNGQQHRTTTKQDGSFALENVGADTWLLRVAAKTADGELTGEQTVEVNRNGATPPVHIDLTPTPTITFVVPGLQEGAMVMLHSPETHTLETATWKDGKLSARLKPGTYQVSKEDEPIGKLTVNQDKTTRFD